MRWTKLLAWLSMPKPQLAQTQQHERHGQCHGHQTDRDRQFDVAVIEVAEAGRETDQNRDRVHQGHRDTAGLGARLRLDFRHSRCGGPSPSMVNSKPGPRRCDGRDSSCAGCLPGPLRGPPRVSTLRTTEPFTAPALSIADMTVFAKKTRTTANSPRNHTRMCAGIRPDGPRTTSQVYR